MADTRRIIALIPLVMTAVSLADKETQRQGALDAASTLKIVGPRDLPGDDVIVALKPRVGDDQADSRGRRTGWNRYR
ncbi:MAG: hypothetical protein RLZ98_3545 [Pseudomonadota bacterium]|jgi:hypothetical protein